MSDAPEEPEDGAPGPGEGAGSGPDEPDAPLRGWIDPDDRLWRHPSEVAGPGPAAGTPSPFPPPPHHNYRSAVMVLVGVGAVMAVVAWVIVLLSPASEHPLESAPQDTAANSPLTTLAGVQNALPAAADAVGHSMVELQATTTHGTVLLVGVAVAEGGLVATTADLLAGLRHLDVVGPGGALQAASVVAMDKASDVALVNVPEDLPVAPFADDTDLHGGDADMALTFVPAGGHAIALHCTPGAVTTVGAAIASGPATTMPSITSSPATPAVMAGEPLLNAHGSVLGILYNADPATSPATFLPSDLVVGVADDLRSQDRVVHGWLGVQGTDAPGGAGAKVAQVQSGGPASGRLQVGQLITAVNATPVRTMAEVRALLYVLPPGRPITVSVAQPAGTKVVDITLGTSS
ncbi:MAG TPA: trypsin-like peptidase domain-containing protein [Acidimicrobiales bacterium]